MTLETLLKELGSPPPEVCIDWALQLHKILPRLPQATSQTLDNILLTAENQPALEKVWSEIQIDDVGILTVDAQFSSAQYQFVARQLTQWSQHAIEQDPIRFAGSRELLNHVLATIEPDSRLQSTAYRPSAAKQLPAKHRSAIVRKRVAYRSLVAVAVVLVAGGLVTTAVRYRGDSNESGDSLVAAPDVAFSLDKRKSPIASELTTSDVNQDDSVAKEMVSELVHSNEALDLGDVPSLKELTTASELIAERDALMPLVDVGDRSSESTIDSTDGTGLRENSRTVLSDLQSTIRQAEAVVAEIDIGTQHPVSPKPDSETVALSSKLRPIVLDFEAMRHTLKLNRLIRRAPKEPVWKLQLTAAEDFVVSPSEEQTLDERGIVTWTVHDEAEDIPRTKIVAQARQTGGHSAGLDWRIYGTAEDLPALVIPLNQKWLGPLQQQLGQFDQFLSTAGEQLQQQSKQANLPSQVRSALRTRRDWVTQQSKLTERIKAVVAQTQRLIDLLDGQFEVSGELVDGTSESAPVILTLPSAKP